MADSYVPLMKSVIARLKATAALTAIVTNARIYSNTPQNATFPYVVVNIGSSPYDDKDSTGMEHEIQIQGFSSNPTPEQAANIRAAVYDALNRAEADLTLDTGTVRHIHYDGIGFVEREPDGVTWQSMIRFRCVVT